MSLLGYIDKKITYKNQIQHMKSYMLIGVPFGVLFVQVIEIFGTSWTEYVENFEIYRIVFVIFFDGLFILPFIFNYFKYEKKYKKLISKVGKNDFVVTSKYNYSSFIKDENYNVVYHDYQWLIGDIYLIEDNLSYSFKDHINKFELGGVKEERKQKLKILNKIK